MDLGIFLNHIILPLVRNENLTNKQVSTTVMNLLVSPLLFKLVSLRVRPVYGNKRQHFFLFSRGSTKQYTSEYVFCSYVIRDF
jgi:hypothetical protein